MSGRPPFQPESLCRSIANNAGSCDELNGRYDYFANWHQDAMLESAIPDADVAASRLLRNGNVHVKSRHTIGIEIPRRHSHSPYFWLREQQSPRSGSGQLNSTSFCHLVHTIRRVVAKLQLCSVSRQFQCTELCIQFVVNSPNCLLSGG